MIKTEEIPTLYQKLKSHIARDFRTTTTTIVAGGGGGGGATSFSGLAGTIANAQAPQFLLRDGSRSLTGSMSVDAGVTIDGVDISAHAADANAHHAQQHSITGGDHTITGATLSLVGATATNTLGLITPSAAPGTTESVLKATSGLLTLPSFTATTSMRTPLIDTSSGDLTISPAGSDVFVNGNIAAQRSTTAVIATYTAHDTAGTGPRFAFYRAGNALDAETATVSGMLLGSLSYRGHTGSAYMTIGAADIRAYASENFTTTATGANLRFYTTTSGTTSISERMRIHNTGNVSILNTTDNGFALDVTGTARITGVTSIASGSVGAPGLTFTGDTNSGIYRSGADAFSLVTGGTAIVNVGATGAGVNAAYDSTAALKVQSVANDDITLLLKQKSGQTARMWRVEDSAGQELIVLDSQGNLQSGNPGFASGLTGWQITPAGNAEFNNITARGELHASIFVMDEFHASGGTLVVSPAGKLENDATVYTTTGAEAILDIRTTSVTGSGSQLDIRTTSGTGSGTQITARWVENYFEITDPPSGHATIFAAGDTLRSKALGNPGAGIDLYDIWGTVSRVEDMTDYYRYYYHRQSGGSNGIVIPAGTGIISYGAEGDGRILLTADQNYAPYIDIFTSGATPWTGDIIPHTRLGRLDGIGLPGVSGVEQYGMVTSTDLSDANAPYIINSNLQMFSYNVDSEWNNGNPTARITSGGVFKLGTDIDSASTTGLDFNPVTGALTIGSASYPGTVTVYGSITVASGSSGYANFSDKPTTLNSINASEYTKINSGLDSSGNLITKVLPGSAVGTPGGAGLFLGSDKMGYYNGSRWLTYIENTGAFVFSSATSAKIAWDGTDLYGTDGTNTQWYARASTGKFYAGNGAVVLDRTGILVANDATSAGITLHRTNAFSSSTKSGRLWALSDLSPARVYFSAGRSVSNDGDASSAAGIMDVVAYDSSGTAAAMLSLNGSSSTISVTGDLDMGGNDIIDANNVMGVRSTAAL